ncbi:hypothetical protein D3C80_451970 [compost metagenome]
MIFEAAAHQHLVVGKQGRRERIALEPLVGLAVEREGQRLAAIDPACGSQTIGGHSLGSLIAAASTTLNTS